MCDIIDRIFTFIILAILLLCIIGVGFDIGVHGNGVCILKNSKTSYKCIKVPDELSLNDYTYDITPSNAVIRVRYTTKNEK